MKYLPGAVVALFILYFLTSLNIPESKGPFDAKTFSQLPLLHGGRIKPFDTVARTALLTLSGKQTTKSPDGTRKSATEWGLETMFGGNRADSWKIFEIDDPDVLGLIGIQQKDERLFPYTDLESHLAVIDMQGRTAIRLPEGKRSRFHRAVLQLREKIFVYERLKSSFRITDSGSQVAMYQALGGGGQQLNMEQAAARISGLIDMADFLPVPTNFGVQENDHDWIGVGQALKSKFDGSGNSEELLAYFQMADAYENNDAPMFNATVTKYFASLKTGKPGSITQSSSETLFNNFEPFYKSMLLYVPVLLLAFVFWLTQKPVFNQTAFYLLILAFFTHSLGLGVRMILQGRPPVTNLYSSAVFVGWGAVLLGIVLERMYRNGVGNVVSGIIGFATLIIAHHLSLQGDTMEMMRAVLDSNFWLTTHVVAITIGYSSTFLSGFIAIIYLFRRAFDRSFDQKMAYPLSRMVYGIVCFSTIFSFVGTVLGGIWADQSWGRFWGWDPKENGALLVVLWNILILHVRTTVQEKTVMMLTVFGNVITVLSWFGVNMLGVGLHSYGFMDKALSSMVIFIVVQCLIMMMGYLPAKAGRSRLAR